MGKTPSSKKPCNTAPVAASPRPVMKNPGSIKNRLKRSEVYGRYLLDKKAQKKQKRLQRVKEAQELGVDPTTRQTAPKTLDNAREVEETLVQPTDWEVLGDEAEDEFAPYFEDTIRPKIIVTTRPRPSAELFYFINDLMRFIPQLYYYPRKSFSVKEICEYAKRKDFTHIMVLSEKQKVCNGMIISHLRSNNTHSMGCSDGGPTAFFKVSNVIPSTDIPHHGSATNHVPELVLNGKNLYIYID